MEIVITVLAVWMASLVLYVKQSNPSKSWPSLVVTVLIIPLVVVAKGVWTASKSAWNDAETTWTEQK